MKSKYVRQFRLFRPIIHFFIILGMFRIAYQTRMWGVSIGRFFNESLRINKTELSVFAMISAVLFVAIGLIKNLYELNKTTGNYIGILSKTWFYWFIAITFISYFGQGFVFKFGISRYVILFSALSALIVLFLFDQIRYFIDFRLQKNTGKRILIVTDGTNENSDLLDKIKGNFSFPVDCVSSKQAEKLNISNYSTVVVAGGFEKEILQKMFEKIRFCDTRLFHVNEGYFLEDVVYKPEKLGNIIAMEYTHSQLDGWALVWKRIFDIVASIFGILLTGWLMIIIAIIIKIDSKGPAIYKSKRVGLGGKLFTFYKFRSMRTDMCVGYGGKAADDMYAKLIASDANNRKGVLPKIKDDPRVTKVGKFIRKTSLDELPQLFQVLWGSMSLVGPRPHLPNEVAQYEEWERRVLSIKPGITGYAQVFGRDHLPFAEEAKLDLYYIQNRSLIMDFYVIFATFGVVFKGH